MAFNMDICNKTSIDHFLDSVVSQGLNLTMYLQACNSTGVNQRGICELAWGAGNPDISGIGAVVAYIAQVGLTCIICPLYAFIFAYYGKHANPHRFHNAPITVSATDFHGRERDDAEGKQRQQKYNRLRWLSENLDTFTDLSCQFSLMISVASIIRIEQGPTFFEKVFLQALVIMQLLAVLAVCVSNILGPDKTLPKSLISRYRKKDKGKKRDTVSVGDDGSTVIGKSAHQRLHLHHHDHEEYHMHLQNQYFNEQYSNHPNKATQRLIRLLFYCISILALFWAFVSRFDVSQDRLAAIQQVIGFCSSNHPEPDPRWNWYTNSDAWPTWFLTLIHISGVAYILVVIIFITVYGLCVVCIYVLTPGGVSLALCGAMIFFLVEMLKQRHYMSKSTGLNFQDDSWGFGQVLALLMWAPFVLWLLLQWLWIFISWCCYNYKHRQKYKKSYNPAGTNDNGQYELTQQQLAHAEEGRADVTDTIADDETEVDVIQDHSHRYVNLAYQPSSGNVRRSSAVRRSSRFVTEDALSHTRNGSSSSHSSNSSSSSPHKIPPVTPVSPIDFNTGGDQLGRTHQTQLLSEPYGAVP